MKSKRLSLLSGSIGLLALACTSPQPAPADSGVADVREASAPADVAIVDAGTCVDMDNDGHPSAACGGDDCDDNNPRRNPSSREVCDNNGFDEDCDPCTVGEVFPGGRGGDSDRDEDGFPSRACFNRVTAGQRPVCDNTSVSTDGGVDAAIDDSGDAAAPPMPARRVVVSGEEVRGTDCDDSSAVRSPAASEVCDAMRINEDCDDEVNEGCECTTGQDRGCVDPMTSMPLLGVCGAARQLCVDGRWAPCPVMPTEEVCDPARADENCDGTSDEGLRVDCFVDRDSDGYAALGAPRSNECGVRTMTGTLACPSGFTQRDPATVRDCNDSNLSINPGAVEIPCDGIDNDCSTASSDTTCPGGMTCASGACRCPVGSEFCAGRCQATGATCTVGVGVCQQTGRTACQRVGAMEVVGCNATANPPVSWYTDCDNDGYGAGTAVVACSAPTLCGRPGVRMNGDCNDTNNTVAPNRTEVCDRLDNNCNGRDDDFAGAVCRQGDSRTFTMCDTGLSQVCIAPGCTWNPEASIVSNRGLSFSLGQNADPAAVTGPVVGFCNFCGSGNSLICCNYNPSVGIPGGVFDRYTRGFQVTSGAHTAQLFIRPTSGTITLSAEVLSGSTWMEVASISSSSTGHLFLNWRTSNRGACNTARIRVRTTGGSLAGGTFGEAPISIDRGLTAEL